MELSKGSLSSNNPSEAAHVALDQSNSKNISAEVPDFIAFNQARSDQIADRLKQIQVKAFSEIEALSLAQSDINKVFEGFDDELKDMIKEKIKDFEEKMQNNFILISDILENLTKLEETLLNFVKSSFDLASHPIEDTEEEDDEDDKASSSGIMSKEISKPDETGELPKRKKIPSKAMTVLRQWLFENMQDPYPSNEVKEDLAKKTNLSYKQVHNWFINARGRIWKKMVNQERFGNMVEKYYVQNANENKK